MRKVHSSGADDVNRAVASARAAQTSWAAMSGFERGQILKRAADIVRVILDNKKETEKKVLKVRETKYLEKLLFEICGTNKLCVHKILHKHVCL